VPGTVFKKRLRLVHAPLLPLRHGHAELVLGAAGEAHVVEVGVRQHDRVDVRRAASQLPKRTVQRPPRAREARVNDRQSSVLDDEAVGEGVVDLMDAVSNVLW
jgi:hypothetical protein